MGVKSGFLENFNKIKRTGIIFNLKKWEFFLIQKIGILFNIETLEKKFSKNHRFVRNFLTRKRLFKNFGFFTKDVFKCLLEGLETIKVIYLVVFEK